jgi:hypothetical protein
MQVSDCSPGEVASIPLLTSDVVETSNDLSVTAAKDKINKRCPVDAVVDVCKFLKLLSEREIPPAVTHQILRFVHEDLSHLINKAFSNMQCSEMKRPFKLGHDKLPYSLYIRANLFKEKEFNYRNVLVSSRSRKDFSEEDKANIRRCAKDVIYGVEDGAALINWIN